jgi:hypothetical protein
VTDFDAATPNAARMYDYFLGGHHHFAADREQARKVLDAEPRMPEIATANRGFLARAVRFMREAGIRQFIDLGSGIPTRKNVHEIAQRDDPAVRVVYVDKDPVAVAHTRRIVRGNDNAAAVQADFRDAAAVLADPAVREMIDLRRPVGLLMLAVLHFVPDTEHPTAVVSGFGQAMAPGSYLAISHGTHDGTPDVAATLAELYQGTTNPVTPRTHARVTRLFAGFDLVEPGLVWGPLWRPETAPRTDPERSLFYAGVGRRMLARATISR